jgi:hypothetical protein
LSLGVFTIRFHFLSLLPLSFRPLEFYQSSIPTMVDQGFLTLRVCGPVHNGRSELALAGAPSRYPIVYLLLI